MNIVLYAEDLEPITVIDLPEAAFSFFRQGMVWNVAVIEPVPGIWTAEEAAELATYRIVTIWAERFQRNNKSSWMLFTRDEEAALLLRSSVLPGQVREHKEQFKRGFAQGFLKAFIGMGGLDD